MNWEIENMALRDYRRQTVCARCLRIRGSTGWTEAKLPSDDYLRKPYPKYNYVECDACKEGQDGHTDTP